MKKKKRKNKCMMKFKNLKKLMNKARKHKFIKKIIFKFNKTEIKVYNF